MDPPHPADHGAAAPGTPADDANAAIWRSDEMVEHWVAGVDDRARGRAPQWRLMAELLPFATHDTFTFLDLGAGTGAAARVLLDFFPASRAVLADFSERMIDEGTRALAPYEGRFEFVTFDMAGGDWPPDLPAPFDAVVTSQSVHHVADERKRTLFAEILDRLAPGGWYLNFDPVATDDPLVEAAWRRVNDRRDPAAAAHRAHRTPEEAARWENHVRHLAPLDRQVGDLRAAGFEAVDVYWKQLDYVIYGGRRPAGR